MNEKDHKLTFWNTAICRKNGKTWAVAEVYENGTPTDRYWLALNYDREEQYDPRWLPYPNGSPIVFTWHEINDFVSRWLRQ